MTTGTPGAIASGVQGFLSRRCYPFLRDQAIANRASGESRSSLPDQRTLNRGDFSVGGQTYVW